MESGATRSPRFVRTSRRKGVPRRQLGAPQTNMAEKKQNTAAVVWEIAEPLAESLGLLLWDVRFLKEGTEWYLRIIIDKENEPVSIEDCVVMSQALDAPLDEADPIDRSYSLQVQSPGIERELTRDFHFKRYLGENVMVRFIRAVDGRREYKGVLEDYADGTVTVRCDDGATRMFDKKEASWIKLDDFGGF